MMFCQVCGAENKDGAKFCYKCGKKLVEITKENENKKNKDEAVEFEDLSDLQYQYAQKINEEIVLKFCMGREANFEQFYGKATLYDLTKEQVNEIALVINRQLKKMYNFIEVQFEDARDFTIDEEEVYEYAKSIEITEETAKLLLDKYKEENQIEKKAEFYQLLLADYLNFETEEDINEYERLDNQEKELVTTIFEKNMQELSEFIKKEYVKTNGLDLGPGQLPAIVAEAIKVGAKDEESAIRIVQKYEDENGITELKNERKAKEFYELENQKLGKNVTWFGKDKIIEGKFFLDKNLTNRLRKIGNKASKDWSNVDKNEDTILGDLALILSRYGSEILEELQQIEEEFSIPGLPPYFSEIQEYIIDKLADVSAVNMVFKNIDENVNVQKAYREVRKQFRNQWSGGGFGIAGALKGAAMAGVLNMGSGVVHSMANAIGNAQTDSKAKAKKKELIHSIIKDTPQEIGSLTTQLIDNIKLHVKAIYPNAIWEKNERVEERSYLLLQKNDDVHGCEYAWNFLMSNPYKVDHYIEIFKRYTNASVKQELEMISEVFELRTVSQSLNNYINRKIKADFEKISVEVIDDIHKLIGIKYGKLDKNGIREELIETLHQQLQFLGGSELDSFVNCLIAYENRENNYDLADKYDVWVKEIAKELEICLCNEVDSLEIPAVEERIDNLLILKKIAQDATKKQIENLVSDSVKVELTCISAEVNINDIENIQHNLREVQRVQSKYGVADFTILESAIKQKIQTIIEDSKGKEELSQIQEKIENIEANTDIDLENEKKEINQLLEKMLLEERTVYDYILVYSKEIKRKKPDIIAQEVGKIFETVEKAEKIRLKVNQIVEIYEKCKYFSYESVKISISQIEVICRETGFGKDVLEDLKQHLEKLDIERRTVLGVTYDTVEEAEGERKKVVGNRKFESEEAANAERKRLQIEKEVSEREMNLISKWEDKMTSPIDILRNILTNNFTSLAAKNKEKLYAKKVLELYSSLKNKNIPLELAKLHTQQLLGIVFGVIAIMVGIGPFLSIGWIGKIVIFCIVAIPWGIMLQAREEVESVSRDKEILKFIETIFVIQGEQIYLKNNNGTNYQNEPHEPNLNGLVKVCVIQKYNDTERGQVLEPGFIFKTSIERADLLVKENVVKRVD